MTCTESVTTENSSDCDEGYSASWFVDFSTQEISATGPAVPSPSQ